MNENGNLEPSDFQPELNRSQGPKSPEAALILSRVVWFALLMSQGMYLFIGPLLLKGKSPAQDLGEDAGTLVAGLNSQVGMIGGVVAASLLGLSFLIPNLISRSANSLSSGTVPKASMPKRLQAKFLQFVIGVALNESVAMMGLMFGFVLLKNSAYGSALVYLSMAGMLARFPTREFFEEPTGPRFS